MRFEGRSGEKPTWDIAEKPGTGAPALGLDALVSKLRAAGKYDANRSTGRGVEGDVVVVVVELMWNAGASSGLRIWRVLRQIQLIDTKKIEK